MGFYWQPALLRGDDEAVIAVSAIVAFAIIMIAIAVAAEKRKQMESLRSGGGSSRSGGARAEGVR